MSIPCTNLMGRRAMKYLNSSNLFTSGFPKGIATIEIVHFRIFTVTIPLSCIQTELTTESEDEVQTNNQHSCAL